MEEKNKKNINRRDFIKIVGISAATYYTDVLLKVLPHQVVYREKGKYLLIK